MKKLNPDWIVDKYIDFEYKKYVLLAYLQDIDKHFQAIQLYPYLSKLIEHYQNLVKIKGSKQALFDAFPKKIEEVDAEHAQLNYKSIIEDDATMHEIEDIVNYSLPKFEHYIKEGKTIYEMVEKQLHVSQVGIVPLYTNEGYMLIKNAMKNVVKVFEYLITIFEQHDEKYRGIHIEYVTSYTTSIACTYEYIKSDLIKRRKKYPQPATYVIEADLSFPFNETYLPIAKRELVKYIAQHND